MRPMMRGGRRTINLGMGSEKCRPHPQVVLPTLHANTVRWFPPRKGSLPTCKLVPQIPFPSHPVTMTSSMRGEVYAPPPCALRRANVAVTSILRPGARNRTLSFNHSVEAYVQGSTRSEIIIEEIIDAPILLEGRKLKAS